MLAEVVRAIDDGVDVDDDIREELVDEVRLVLDETNPDEGNFVIETTYEERME